MGRVEVPDHRVGTFAVSGGVRLGYRGVPVLLWHGGLITSFHLLALGERRVRGLGDRSAWPWPPWGWCSSVGGVCRWFGGEPLNTQLDIMCIIGVVGMSVGKGLWRLDGLYCGACARR